MTYRDKVYGFSSSYHKNHFMANPEKYKSVQLPDKLPVQFEKKNLVKKVAKQVECTAYLEHHLGSIVMRVLAQLGYNYLLIINFFFWLIHFFLNEYFFFFDYFLMFGKNLNFFLTGYKRLKYPTLTCKDTALKFIAISLKASNPNASESCRQKYREKL